MMNPSCFGCRHFQITHEPSLPYACRAFQFRSRRMPALDVAASSGEPCNRREQAQTQTTSPTPTRNATP